MDGAVGLWTCGCWESQLPAAAGEKTQMKLTSCTRLARASGFMGGSVGMGVPGAQKRAGRQHGGG